MNGLRIARHCRPTPWSTVKHITYDVKVGLLKGQRSTYSDQSLPNPFIRPNKQTVNHTLHSHCGIIN